MGGNVFALDGVSQTHSTSVSGSEAVGTTVCGVPDRVTKDCHRVLQFAPFCSQVTGPDVVEPGVSGFKVVGPNVSESGPGQSGSFKDITSAIDGVGTWSLGAYSSTSTVSSFSHSRRNGQARPGRFDSYKTESTRRDTSVEQRPRNGWTPNCHLRHSDPWSFGPRCSPLVLSQDRSEIGTYKDSIHL